MAGTRITLRSLATGVEHTANSDSHGYYQIGAIPVGVYRLSAWAPGFQTYIVEDLSFQVGQAAVQDLRLAIGDTSQEVRVISEPALVDLATTSVGTVVDSRTVQEIPLNGRYFLDLAQLVPGSVIPPQGAFSAAPIRGIGSLAINTAGNREESVNYMINGITLNDLIYSAITFQPSIETVQEFKIDNSTFHAEYGQSSGAIISIATRSGANQFHGGLFEFLRNDAFDARNFFAFTSSEPQPYKRNQFGGNFSGPIRKDKTFFFSSYEGVRQSQQVDINSVVLSQSERASADNPVIARLIALVPEANFVDSSGTSRFIGSAAALANADQWTIDGSHNLSPNDRLHAYYAINHGRRIEPTRTGNTIPGFGHIGESRGQILTLNETHIFRHNFINEARAGFNRLFGENVPGARLNPAEFGIGNGVNRSVGLPQFNIAGGGLNFGGPSMQPVGRGDTTFVFSDAVSYLRGNHSLKLGGEFRQFLNNNFAAGSGSFNFPTIASFVAGTANSFTTTVGERTSSIAQGTLAGFIQDQFKWRRGLTLDLGLRYEWNMTPVERYDRFIVFDPETSSLLRVGRDIDVVYHQNNSNFEPRVGLAWDPFRDGRTSVRAAYGFMVDQPMTSVVTGTTANPPLAVPLAVVGAVRIENAIAAAQPTGLAPQTVDGKYNNAYLQSWNLNIQRELKSRLAVTAGYFGSAGTHLRLSRNINQPSNNFRPYAALSDASPILPGLALGNITQIESSGNSSYNALWLSANQRLSGGMQFQASYTWSKSIDYNSLSTQGIVVQNSYDIRADRGPSDYDARHRFVFSGIYELPFHGSRLVDGWQLAAIVQAQSGSPFNIVTGASAVNGVANTVRPDVTLPVTMFHQPERWFDPAAFTAVPRFGNLGRNVVVGPRFDNTDLSITKVTNIGERGRLQFRAECFNLFNHPNFGPPGRVVGVNGFGVITSTRFPTGDPGSARQVQFAIRFNF